MPTQTPYGITIQLDRPFDQTVEATRAALAAEGFGILVEADLQATFKKKLDVDHTPYVLLGACSPRDAYEALQHEPDLGLLLPCNVIVRDAGNGKTHVAALDASVQLSLTGNTAVAPAAAAIRDRVIRALSALEKSQ
ncbi:MAG: DUF302 domain-containing protein [Gemmatimonadaceae bacterium]|nr:DUF302 domain-containing protein [Gemmatimonadaceae bacterium]